MKLALALAALLVPALGHAEENCAFQTSVGKLDVTFGDEGDVHLRRNGTEINPGSCRAENSFRRSTTRCPFFVNSDLRLELYRSYFPNRVPPLKVSLVVWSHLTGANPSVENVSGNCAN